MKLTTIQKYYAIESLKKLSFETKIFEFNVVKNSDSGYEVAWDQFYNEGFVSNNNKFDDYFLPANDPNYRPENFYNFENFKDFGMMENIYSIFRFEFKYKKMYFRGGVDQIAEVYLDIQKTDKNLPKFEIHKLQKSNYEFPETFKKVKNLLAKFEFQESELKSVINDVIKYNNYRTEKEYLKIVERNKQTDTEIINFFLLLIYNKRLKNAMNRTGNKESTFEITNTNNKLNAFHNIKDFMIETYDLWSDPTFKFLEIPQQISNLTNYYFIKKGA